MFNFFFSFSIGEAGFKMLSLQEKENASVIYLRL